ncbi:hypothetical protein [Paractinoplanes hotanensis]|uniref:Uncharacterized protein n=1 Tax=Paractinoplanes hotanensis TaxID=2906497 RepID=A0ABT0YCS1_9ACTN|nr:hypothetical protein [Actinoplanes hotanensis]MCM4083846.1 hypothetical protein [Actinoplanes hotanensis]
MAMRQVGDPVVMTAVVVAVMTARAFVIADADLPDQGTLVLGVVPPGLEQRGLVTVRGVVDEFDFDRLSAPYGLERRERYTDFESRKVVVAHSVRSWA